MSDQLKQQFEVFKAQLIADKKKAAILAGLALVLLVVGGRQLFKSTPDFNEPPLLSVPATASAAPVAAQPQTAVTPQVTAQPPAAATPPAAAEAPAGAPSEQRTVSVEGMPRELVRDLFSTKKWNKFVPAMMAEADDTSSAGRKRKQGGFWSHLRQSWSEYNREKNELTQSFRNDLEKLILQSTMTGVEPMAYISGHLVRPGDAIAGFSVVEIDDRQVVISREGMSASLVMK